MAYSLDDVISLDAKARRLKILFVLDNLPSHPIDQILVVGPEDELRFIDFAFWCSHKQYRWDA